MIQKGTYLNVIDNSGANEICCIHINGGYRRRYAKLGDVIIASIKTIRFKEGMKIKKGGIVKALVVRTKRFFSVKKKIDNSIKFLGNDAILYSPQNKTIGTRIVGGLQKEFLNTKYRKVVSLSSGIIK